MVNWATKPRATAFGIRPTARKSSKVSVSPMPSMMMARPHTIHGPLNQVNHAGWKKAMMPPASTHTGKAFVSRVSTRDMAAEPATACGS